MVILLFLVLLLLVLSACTSAGWRRELGLPTPLNPTGGALR